MDKKTPLYDWHREHQAKMAPFAGFQMPIQYSGIQVEHRAVREKAGLFDVSHMGNFLITGANALQYLQKITVNDVSHLKVLDVQYSALCYENGTVIDDILVTYVEPGAYHLVVNASNIQKDWDWMNQHLMEGVELKNQSEELGVLALQGPLAKEILQKLTDINLNELETYKTTSGLVAGISLVFSRTGYTGEDGFELYPKNKDAQSLWTKLLEVGEPMGLLPVGLGARDTLRLEAGYSLYGHELTEQTNLVEAGLSWIVDWTGADFIGKASLQKIKKLGVQRKLVGIELLDKGIAREGYPIERDGKEIGVITSGSISPSSTKAIALAYINKEQAVLDTEVDIVIRNKRKKAKVVRRYFYKREK